MRNNLNNKPTINMENITEELEVRSQKLANQVRNLNELKAEKASVNKDFNERIKSIESIMGIMAEEVQEAISKINTNMIDFEKYKVE